MLINYYLTLCIGSSIDQHTEALTLFRLLEEVPAPRRLLGKVIPIEVHIGWLSGSALWDKEIETRRVLWGSNDDGKLPEFVHEEASRFTIDDGVDKICTRDKGFLLPPVYGEYMVQVEWRVVGDSEWTRDPAVWPLTVRPLRKDEEV